MCFSLDINVNRMKKIIIGIAAGAMMLVIGLLVSFVFQTLFPSIQTEYQNPSLFRPWTDPLMSLYFVEPFITGIILVWIWNLSKGLIKGNKWFNRGLLFGLIYWVICIPGMIMSYTSFPISLLLVGSWSLTILLQALCSGLLFSKSLN